MSSTIIKVSDNITENFVCTVCGLNFFSEGPCPECYMDPNLLCFYCQEEYHEYDSMFCAECNKLPKSYCAVCGQDMPFNTETIPIFCSKVCEDQVHDKKEICDLLGHIQKNYEYYPDIKDGHDWADYRIFESTAFDNEYGGDVAWDEHMNFVSCVWRSPEGILYELYRDGRTWIDMMREGETPFSFEWEGEWWEFVTAEGKCKWHEHKEKNKKDE